MDFPQIRIQSHMPQINIKQTMGEFSIQQPKPVQSIEQPKAKMEIDRVPSKLMIDQTQAWHDMDLKLISYRMEEAANQGREDLLKGIARRIRQGDELMRIENQSDPIPKQAVENGHDAQKPINIKWIPSVNAVKISYEPGQVDIRITQQKPIIKTEIYKPAIEFNKGSVDISLQQRNELTIDFENLKYKNFGFEISI